MSLGNDSQPIYLARRRRLLASLRSIQRGHHQGTQETNRHAMLEAPLPQSAPRSDSAVAAPQRSLRSPSPLISRQNGRRLIAFGWYGGKFSHLRWLLPLLPGTRQYCEPFGGSAAVLLNRAPAEIETYNDIDGEVVNFFRVLRSHRREFVEALVLTPFSREEFALACEPVGDEVGAFERARRFFVRARQVRTGLARTASLGRWANCKNTSRSGMSGVVSRWINGVEGLLEIAERLARVRIENRPAIDLIRLYDDANTLFYVDPPYPHESRSDSKAYGYEMSEKEHRGLAKTLHAACGKVAVSGYQCPLMNELYGEWRVTTSEIKQTHSSKGLRQEALWTNY